MIGCPTGAIHRSVSGGMVIINDDTCIGCETCANSCPYSNIRMVSIRDEVGSFITDPQNQKPMGLFGFCGPLISGDLGMDHTD